MLRCSHGSGEPLCVMAIGRRFAGKVHARAMSNGLRRPVRPRFAQRSIAGKVTPSAQDVPFDGTAPPFEPLHADTRLTGRSSTRTRTAGTVVSNKQSNSLVNLSKRIAIAGIALWAISLPTASFALGTAEERSACTGDVFRLCSAEIPNTDRIVACLKSKKASLSTACRSVFDRPASHSARTSD